MRCYHNAKIVGTRIIENSLKPCILSGIILIDVVIKNNQSDALLLIVLVIIAYIRSVGHTPILYIWSKVSLITRLSTIIIPVNRTTRLCTIMITYYIKNLLCTFHFSPEIERTCVILLCNIVTCMQDVINIIVVLPVECHDSLEFILFLMDVREMKNVQRLHINTLVFCAKHLQLNSHFGWIVEGNYTVNGIVAFSNFLCIHLSMNH